MNIPLRPMLIVFCLVASSPVFAQQNEESLTPASAGASARTESLTHWEYCSEVTLTPAGEAKWYDFVLTPAVFDGARVDLADLRLYDAGERELPFALRVRREESELSTIEAEEFNRLTQDDGNQQVTLDLGKEQIQQNEIEILTTGLNFRRLATVEGSDDREEWHEIASGYLINYEHGDRHFVESTIDYAPSRFRYLRVTVHPDPQEDTKRDWEIHIANVRRRLMLPGEQVTLPVTFQDREPVRTLQGPGSQWLIDLAGASVPCKELNVEITSGDFVRDWTVEAASVDLPGEKFHHIASGTWQRKAGEEQTRFTATFSKEIRAARLKLQITDYRNPPLVIKSMEIRAPARQVVFEAQPNALEGPLRLYFGNPDAEQPNYDFARNLPPQLEPPPARLKLGERQENPRYDPVPPPLTERLPWLVQTVLSISIVVLAGLIFSLARASIKETDSKVD